MDCLDSDFVNFSGSKTQLVSLDFSNNASAINIKTDGSDFDGEFHF